MTKAVLLLTFSLLGCGRTTAPSASNQADPFISRFTGTCEMQLGSSKPWIPIMGSRPVQEGSRIRAGANSSVGLQTTSRILLAQNSEIEVKQWAHKPGADSSTAEIEIGVREGLIFIDVPAITAPGSFQVSGRNFLASIRSLGRTVAAIKADGYISVQSGTILCIRISNSVPAATVTLNAGEMFDPIAKISKQISDSSNGLSNPLLK